MGRLRASYDSPLPPDHHLDHPRRSQFAAEDPMISGCEVSAEWALSDADRATSSPFGPVMSEDEIDESIAEGEAWGDATGPVNGC